MIVFEGVTITYAGAQEPVLHEVDLVVPEGELALVVGATGSGKSTFLRAVNGHMPRFTGGRLQGVVRVDGRRTDSWEPRDLADVVGVVGQDPVQGFVTDTVEDELAYVMENLGIAPEVMRRRVEDVLDLLGLHPHRSRALRTLSGGEQQRVAIGSVLTAHPRVLVLDEPTSALDPAAAEEVLAALTRLVHDTGTTLLVAEHRLERVLQYADRLIVVQPDGRVVSGTPIELMADAPVAPPVVELGRRASWNPLPLSVRDARRLAGPLREVLEGRQPAPSRVSIGSAVARVVDLTASYGTHLVLRNIDLDVHLGEVLAIMGRNGSGKSTLLAHLAGLLAAAAGMVQVAGKDPAATSPHELIRHVGLVPQDPGLLLYAASVAEECRSVDLDAKLPAGTTRGILEELQPGIDERTHPRDLSEGQRLMTALGVVLSTAPQVVLLDEPTRGLDYSAKRRLIGLLTRLASEGHAVVLSTHDVEVVAEVADRVVVLADGEVVADGPARDVITHSPVFAPQVAKILAPLPWMTVGELEAAGAFS